MMAERIAILAPTLEGHKAEWINEECRGDWTAIECECGWREFCEGFDCGAIAQCAYSDHLEEELAPSQGRWERKT